MMSISASPTPPHPSARDEDASPGGARLLTAGKFPPADVLAHLDLAATLLAWGGPALGLIRGLRVVVAGGEGIAQVPWTGVALDFLFLVGLWTLAGVTSGALLRALGRGLLIRLASGQAAVFPAGGDVHAGGLALKADGRAPSAGSALEDIRAEAVAEVRHAIRQGHWDEAKRRLDALALNQADDRRIEGLARELEAAREAARVEHLADLEAARSVNDPDRVLELHRFLVPLLEDEARRALEAELSGWFLRLIHNRLRTGRIQAELAELAARIAETFSHTVEGASLRASLPTLRRSAGLCPRCAQPYTGIADACPACLAQARDVPAR